MYDSIQSLCLMEPAHIKVPQNYSILIVLKSNIEKYAYEL